MGSRRRSIKNRTIELALGPNNQKHLAPHPSKGGSSAVVARSEIGLEMNRNGTVALAPAAFSWIVSPSGRRKTIDAGEVSRSEVERRKNSGK
jgi:hypothetical protein